MVPDILKLSFLSNLKTNNIIIDIFITLIFLYGTSFVSNRENMKTIRSLPILVDIIKSFFVRKYSISFEGKQTSVITKFDTRPVISTCFTDSFKAILFDVLNNIDINHSIYEVKEYITAQGFDDCLEDMFIVTQTEKILYNKDLRLYVTIEHSIQNNDNEKKEGFIKTNEMSNMWKVLNMFVKFQFVYTNYQLLKTR